MACGWLNTSRTVCGPGCAARHPAAVSESNPDSIGFAASSEVEVTSEDAAYPIESGLLSETAAGWRAAQPGPQTVRLVFNQPQAIKRVHLEFDERELERTQQFVLRWSADGGH